VLHRTLCDFSPTAGRTHDGRCGLFRFQILSFTYAPAHHSHTGTHAFGHMDAPMMARPAFQAPVAPMVHGQPAPMVTGMDKAEQYNMQGVMSD